MAFTVESGAAGGLRIRVTTDLSRFILAMNRTAERQVPFALARALTMTAQDAQADVKAQLPKRFTLRNNWVSSGIRIKPATKGTPEAIVGSLEPFMERQELGGTKQARAHSRVAVPVNVKRSKRDRIPKGQRPAALKGQPRILSIRGSNIVTTKGGAGILRRVGRDRYPLQILYWLKRGVRVQPRFGFKGTASNTVQRQFGDNFVKALADAMATAR
jgi:hypothetical protein